MKASAAASTESDTDAQRRGRRRGDAAQQRRGDHQAGHRDPVGGDEDVDDDDRRDDRREPRSPGRVPAGRADEEARAIAAFCPTAPLKVSARERRLPAVSRNVARPHAALRDQRALSKDRPMRLITSSLRAQLFAGVRRGQSCSRIGVVVAITQRVEHDHHAARADTTRVKMVDTLSTDTYDMQGSQLMDDAGQRHLGRGPRGRRPAVRCRPR